MHYLNQKDFLPLSAVKTLMFSVLFSFLFSCVSGQPEKFTFVGRWQVNQDETLSQMSAAKRSSYEAKPVEVRDVLKKSIGDRFYEFKKDSTVVFSITRRGRTNSFVGTWRYDADSGKLVTTSEKGVETRFNIIVMSPDKVVLKNEKIDARSMLDDWVLQRIKN
jgi:hypothetical protein